MSAEIIKLVPRLQQRPVIKPSLRAKIERLQAQSDNLATFIERMVDDMLDELAKSDRDDEKGGA